MRSHIRADAAVLANVDYVSIGGALLQHDILNTFVTYTKLYDIAADWTTLKGIIHSTEPHVAEAGIVSSFVSVLGARSGIITGLKRVNMMLELTLIEETIYKSWLLDYDVKVRPRLPYWISLYFCVERRPSQHMECDQSLWLDLF